MIVLGFPSCSGLRPADDAYNTEGVYEAAHVHGEGRTVRVLIPPGRDALLCPRTSAAMKPILLGRMRRVGLFTATPLRMNVCATSSVITGVRGFMHVDVMLSAAFRPSASGGESSHSFPLTWLCCPTHIYGGGEGG